MDLKIFSSLGTYGQIYFYLASGGKTRDEISKHLKECGKKPTTAIEHVNKAMNGDLPYISCRDEKVILDMEGINEVIKNLVTKFQCETILEPKHKKSKKPEDEIMPLTNNHSPQYIKQMNKANEAQNQVQSLKNQIASQAELIKKMKKHLQDKVEDAVLECMDSKVLVNGKAEFKPPEKFQRDFFLANQVTLLDVNQLISEYGGEIVSLYEPMFSKEKELTTDHYIQSIWKKLKSGNLFKERLEEQEKLSKVNKTEKADGVWVKRDSINLLEIEKNRLESINTILQMEVSNQMKLTLYAAWFDSVDPEMVELLNYAGDQDINADYVIRLLEKPKEYRNYRTIRALMQQAKKASEAHIKREAAVELISGDWYVEANYRGKMCRFQMMPVNEMEQFKKFLMKHQSLEAIATLELLLTEKREAFFEDDNADGKIHVKSKGFKNSQLTSPDFLHEEERESGVNCHPKINEDDAYEGFSETEQEETGNGK